VTEEPLHPPERLGLGGQWIKANVLGGLAYALMAFVDYAIAHALDVSDAVSSVVAQAIYVVLGTAATTLGLLALGFLTGLVLRTKLPAFPMRLWLAFYVVLGVIVGLISTFNALVPETTQEPGPYDLDAVGGLILGALVIGMLAGALLGALQALIIRRAAVGWGLWIVRSALAGSLFVIVIPLALYGPQTGFGGEVMIEAGVFVATIVAAIIMLPAVRRLRPR
jgi:hypothetical protein